MKTKYLKILEKYFNGEMTGDESLAFKRDLKNDPELEASYREYEQIINALSDKEILSLRKTIDSISREEDKKGRPPGFFSKENNWVWLAALLAISVSFTIVVTLLVKHLQPLEPKPLSTVITTEAQAFEKLNAELQKYGMRKHGMNLSRPTRQTNFFNREIIRFQWTVDSTYNLLLDVLDREGTVVFETRHHLESPYVFRKRLDSGLYIFRFRSDTETFNLTMIYLD